MAFNQAENTRMHREKRRAAGLCIYCGTNLAAPGRVACKRCARQRIEYMRNRRLDLIAQGFCSMCGKVPHADGILTCDACRHKMSERNRDRYAKEREARHAPDRH